MSEKMNLSQYLEATSAGHRPGYAAGQVFRLLADVKAAFVVSFGGYRWTLYRCEGSWVAAVPLGGKNADRGTRLLCMVDGRPAFDTPFCCFTHKLDEAGAELGRLLIEHPDSKGLLFALSRKAGVCSICGALLTDQVSVARGIGPECVKKFWVRDILEGRK